MTETDAFRDRVAELEALLGVGNEDVSRLLTVVDATPQQCEMIGFMLKRAVATRTALFIALFGARPECDQPDMKLIDVQMVKVGQDALVRQDDVGSGADVGERRARRNHSVRPRVHEFAGG